MQGGFPALAARPQPERQPHKNFKENASGKKGMIILVLSEP
jgi:hypothetical protein